jgi:hypothetical protein
MLLILVVLVSAGSGVYAGASFFAQQGANVTVTTTIYTTTTSWTASTIWSTVTEVVQGVLTTVEYATSTSTVTVTGSTTYRTGKIVTASGNARISTAQSKFGGASGVFHGYGDYLSTPDSTDWAFASGDFTIDFWVRRGALGTRQVIFGQSDAPGTATSASFLVEFQADNTVRLKIFDAVGREYTATSTGRVVDTTTWHHVAGLRNGNTLRLFIDGVADGAGNCAGVTMNDSSAVLSVGRTGLYNSLYFNGWLDEFRISKGVARWTSNFTPSASAYTTDSYTVLLLHMDGSDASTTFTDG